GALSYRSVDRPFLRAGSRPSARTRQGHALRLALFAVVAAVLGIALARIHTTNPLAEVLHAGEKVIAAQPPPAPVPETTTTATTAPPAPVAAPVSAAVRPVRVQSAPAPAPAPAPRPNLSLPPPGTVPVTAIG